MNERIKLIRKERKLSQDEFGDRIGVTKTSISKIEKGINNPSDQTIMLICKEFGVNEEWLRTGEGNPRNIIEDDEVALYVSDLLEEDDNPFFEIIMNIMKTYSELDPKSQKVVLDMSTRLIENMQNKKEV